MPILPADRDPRLITVRRGGSLTDEHHHLLAEWAAVCAEHVLPLFERARPDDTRPRDAIAVGRAWVRGEVRMRDAHNTGFTANAAARELPAPAKYAALAAGQAVAVAHVAAHALGAAAYAIRAAAAAAATSAAAEAARIAERDWQRARIPAKIRALVLDDQRLRSAICWNMFDDANEATAPVAGEKKRAAKKSGERASAATTARKAAAKETSEKTTAEKTAAKKTTAKKTATKKTPAKKTAAKKTAAKKTAQRQR